MHNKPIAWRNGFGLLVVLPFVMLILWGCYPKQVGPPGPDGRLLTWPEMNRQQRMVHMKNEVLPRAASIFGSWRPERFASVDCTLCHGQGAVTATFKMPTDHLPRLSGEVLLGPEFEKHPQTTRLKLNRLVPEIAFALGVKKFSIISRSGFGCYSCHLGPEGPLFVN